MATKKVKLVKLAAFKFDLRQVVVITESGETGTIHGRAEYANAEACYYIRYMAADGRATEAWWSEGALRPA